LAENAAKQNCYEMELHGDLHDLNYCEVGLPVPSDLNYTKILLDYEDQEIDLSIQYEEILSIQFKLEQNKKSITYFMSIFKLQQQLGLVVKLQS